MTEKILYATDQIMAGEQYYSRDEAPGGSVSFLFERSTKTAAEDKDGADGETEE